MTDFAKQNPVRSSFWGETDDLSLVDAALLTFGIEPFSLDKYIEVAGEPVTLDELPNGFLLRIEALRSSIRAGALRTIALSYDNHERIDENHTRIKTADFVAWCAAKQLPHNIPNRTGPQPLTKWPWGDYETELLCKMATAAKEWWSTYDPAAPGTAPTNQEVKDWLVGQGVSDRVAESMATILRADGLQTGPRPR